MPFVKKTKNEKMSESINLRLSKEDHEKIKQIAQSRGLSESALVISLLAEIGCFNYDISDEDYEKLKSSDEMRFVVSRRIPKDQLHTMRCWLNHNDKKSITHHAVINEHCSVSIFVNDIVTGFLRSKS